MFVLVVCWFVGYGVFAVFSVKRRFPAPIPLFCTFPERQFGHFGVIVFGRPQQKQNIARSVDRHSLKMWPGFRQFQHTTVLLMAAISSSVPSSEASHSSNSTYTSLARKFSVDIFSEITKNMIPSKDFLSWSKLNNPRPFVISFRTSLERFMHVTLNFLPY